MPSLDIFCLRIFIAFSRLSRTSTSRGRPSKLSKRSSLGSTVITRGPRARQARATLRLAHSIQPCGPSSSIIRIFLVDYNDSCSTLYGNARLGGRRKKERPVNFTGVKVFSATKAREREELGENVTQWIRTHPEA